LAKLTKYASRAATVLAIALVAVTMRPAVVAAQNAQSPVSSPTSSDDAFRAGAEAYRRKDYAAALSSFRQAADNGDAKAQYILGTMYGNGVGVTQDYRQAMIWLRRAADRGDASGQHDVGIMYRDGLGVPQNYREAVNWIRKAADQGNAGAQYDIGLLYERGQGVPQDYRQAMTWYAKAADQGDVDAQFSVGLMYVNGHGVPQDYRQAMIWFRKAADQGHSQSQYNVGWLYEHGEGVQQNTDEAIAWFSKAATQGNAGARDELQRLQSAADHGPIKVSAAGETIDILCTAKNGEAKTIFADPGRRYVKVGDDEFRDGNVVSQTDVDVFARIAGRSTAPYKVKQYVQIDETKIRFGNEQRSYELDRYSGILHIMYYNKFGFEPIHCVPRSKKL
jgi:TPR repeat protein